MVGVAICVSPAGVVSGRGFKVNLIRARGGTRDDISRLSSMAVLVGDTALMLWDDPLAPCGAALASAV
jgi:hypothetical protein